jgi:hypothetical protein
LLCGVVEPVAEAEVVDVLPNEKAKGGEHSVPRQHSAQLEELPVALVSADSVPNLLLVQHQIAHRVRETRTHQSPGQVRRYWQVLQSQTDLLELLFPYPVCLALQHLPITSHLPRRLVGSRLGRQLRLPLLMHLSQLEACLADLEPPLMHRRRPQLVVRPLHQRPASFPRLQRLRPRLRHRPSQLVRVCSEVGRRGSRCAKSRLRPDFQ